jgi:hypothetical protein
MENGPVKRVTESDMNCVEPLPRLKAGREVGWIFTDGEAVAIERHQCEIRTGEDAN